MTTTSPHTSASLSLRGLKLATLASAALLLVNCVDPEISSSGGVTKPGADGAGGGSEHVTRSTRLLPDSDYTRDLEIYDNVKVLDATHLTGAVKTDQSLALDANAASQLDLQVGDVLVSDQQDGIFRVVTQLQPQGSGQLMLTTRPAKLEDAIANGEIYMAKFAEEGITPPEHFAAGVDTSSQGLLVRSQGLGFDKDVGWNGTLYSYNESFADRLNAKINDDHFQVLLADVSAEIGAEVYANVKTELAFPPKIEIDGARVASNGKVVGNIRLRFESDDTFSYNDTIQLIGPSSSEPLTTMEPVRHTLLPGIFPLQFTFSVDSELTINASADGEFQADVGYQVVAGASAGVEKKDGEWRFIKRTDLVPQPWGPVYRGEKNARADAYMTTTLSLTIGEKANGYAHLKPADVTAEFSQEINADTGACPQRLYLHATGSFEGQLASIDIPLIGEQSIMDDAISRTIYDRTLIDHNVQLELPGICDPGYMPPTHAGDKLPGEKCGGNEECAYADCYKNTCVNPGQTFRVAAAWYESTDGDLFVETPSGKEISYSSPTNDGGRHNFSTCYRECSESGPHVENVYFDEQALDGTYKVWVKNADGRAGSSLDIEVRMGDDTLTFSGELPASSGESSEVFEFTLEGGQLVGGMSMGGSGGPQG